MTLTAKQEGFAQSIADSMSQADAYRTNYSAEKMSDKQVWEEASKLAANPKVAQRIAELRQALAEKQLWTRADSVDVLKSIAQNKQSPEAARVSSIRELNAMHGFNEPSKLEVTTALPTIVKLVAPKRGD